MKYVTEAEFLAAVAECDKHQERDIEYSYDVYTRRGVTIGFASYHSYQPTTYALLTGSPFAVYSRNSGALLGIAIADNARDAFRDIADDIGDDPAEFGPCYACRLDDIEEIDRVMDWWKGGAPAGDDPMSGRPVIDLDD